MKPLNLNGMTFGISADGRILHVDDVANGSRCGCICPHCKSPLVAKNAGHERQHHFAHLSTPQSIHCQETALHHAAKQLISHYKQLALPRTLDELPENGLGLCAFEEIKLEHMLPAANGHIVADCYAISPNFTLIIEVAVHHKVDATKAEKLQTLEIPAIEIDLSDQVGMGWNWDDLKYATLEDLARRQWIQAPNELGQIIPDPSSTRNEGRNEWYFSTGSTWITVRELPLGNVAVYHRYDERARQIVEPICRSRGYWNAKYRNWIVFDQFKQELLRLLSSNATPLILPTLEGRPLPGG